MNNVMCRLWNPPTCQLPNYQSKIEIQNYYCQNGFHFFQDFSYKAPNCFKISVETAKLCHLKIAFPNSSLMANSGNKNIQAKLVVLGDMGTGKTSLVLRFAKGQFFEYQESTIGAAFFTQVLSLNEATIKYDIWDTAGQERYHSLAPMYYRGAAAAVVVYDITSMDSFLRAKRWVQELQRQGNPNLIMCLAANKVDLGEKRQVAVEEGEQYARENGLYFIETSAKTTQNVNELFYEIAKRLAKANPSCPTGLKLHSRSQERGRGVFCCST